MMLGQGVSYRVGRRVTCRWYIISSLPQLAAAACSLLASAFGWVGVLLEVSRESARGQVDGRQQQRKKRASDNTQFYNNTALYNC